MAFGRKHKQEKVDKHDPAKNPLYHKELDSKWRRILMIIGIVLLVVALGVATYKYVIRPRMNDKDKSPTASVDNSAQTAATAITSATKNHVSQNLALGFDYPQDWTVTDTAGSGQITVVSPDIQLTDATGQKVSSQITMTIRNKQQKLPEFDSGNALAIRQSEKINYTKPTQSQRGSTHISFLRYASTSAAGGLDGIYITGDTGYTKDQAVPRADFVPVDPIISITFTSNGAPLSIATSNWDNPNFSQPLRSMLQSLAIS